MSGKPENNQPLRSTLVANPRHWRLMMCIGDEALDVAVVSDVEDNTLIWRRIGYDAAAGSKLKAIETAIYDNPLLLADFGRVDILFDTQKMLLLPGETEEGNAEAGRERIEALYPNQPLAVYTNTVNNAIMAFAVPVDVFNFVQRTYPQALVRHRLASLAAYQGVRKNVGNMGIIYVRMHERRVDIVAYNRGQLLMANTFTAPTIEDALFYVLSAASWLEYSDETDRMLVSGVATRRDELLNLLRPRIRQAMPDIFPTALFRMGGEAMQAPFELLCLTLI